MDFFSDNPWEGILEDVVFGDTHEELTKNGKYEGFFQQTYEIKSGRRISYGYIDDLTPRVEIKELEEKEKVNMIKRNGLLFRTGCAARFCTCGNCCGNCKK